MRQIKCLSTSKAEVLYFLAAAIISVKHMYMQLLEDQCLHNIPHWRLLSKCLYVCAWSCRTLPSSGWGHHQEFDKKPQALFVTSYYPKDEFGKLILGMHGANLMW